MRPIQSKKGFTLVELLVVIAVISMLASIVLVALGPVRERGRDARRQSDIRQISTAMELCYDDVVCGGASQRYRAFAGPQPPTDIGVYMDPLPADPLNNDVRKYWWVDNTGSTGDYCIFAVLEEPGGGGDWVYSAAGPGGVRRGLAAQPVDGGDLGAVAGDSISEYPFSLANCENIIQ